LQTIKFVFNSFTTRALVYLRCGSIVLSFFHSFVLSFFLFRSEIYVWRRRSRSSFIVAWNVWCWTELELLQHVSFRSLPSTLVWGWELQPFFAVSWIWIFTFEAKRKKEKKKRCPFHRNTMFSDWCMCVCVTEKKSDTSCLFVFFSVGLSVCLSSCLFLYHNVNLPLSDRFSLEFLC